MVEVVGMLNTGYRCLVGVAMEMASTCYIAPTVMCLRNEPALCTHEKTQAPSLCFLVWRVGQ